MAVATQMDEELDYELDCPCSCNQCEAGIHDECEYGACWLTLSDMKPKQMETG